MTGLFRLFALYCAQGLPFGFATLFVPLELAHRPDFSYAKGTLVQLAGFPWFLKMLWAPAADTRYVAAIGRRRSWILPAQALLAITAFVAAFVLDFKGALVPLFAIVATMNLWASIQDTAVDGLAVDTLTEAQRGLGNAVQVGGYKVGMLLGGSGLVYLASVSSPRLSMGALGLAVLLLMLVPLFYREPPPPARVESAVHHHGTKALGTVLAKLREPSWLVTLAFIGTVKVGEAMVGSIIKPYLVREANFTDARAAFAVGIVGGTLSLAGSVLGGWASSFGRLRMLAAFGVIQGVTVLALGLAVMLKLPDFVLVAAIGIEHFGVGLLTPVLFAYMMDVTDPDVGATHYTLLATVELVAKSAGSILSGPLSDHLGAAPLMLLAGTAGALPLLLMPWIRRPAADVALAPA